MSQGRTTVGEFRVDHVGRQFLIVHGLVVTAIGHHNDFVPRSLIGIVGAGTQFIVVGGQNLDVIRRVAPVDAVTTCELEVELAFGLVEANLDVVVSVSYSTLALVEFLVFFRSHVVALHNVVPYRMVDCFGVFRVAVNKVDQVVAHGRVHLHLSGLIIGYVGNHLVRNDIIIQFIGRLQQVCHFLTNRAAVDIEIFNGLAGIFNGGYV